MDKNPLRLSRYELIILIKRNISETNLVNVLIEGYSKDRLRELRSSLKVNNEPYKGVEFLSLLPAEVRANIYRNLDHFDMSRLKQVSRLYNNEVIIDQEKYKRYGKIFSRIVIEDNIVQIKNRIVRINALNTREIVIEPLSFLTIDGLVTCVNRGKSSIIFRLLWDFAAKHAMFNGPLNSSHFSMTKIAKTIGKYAREDLVHFVKSYELLVCIGAVKGNQVSFLFEYIYKAKITKSCIEVLYHTCIINSRLNILDKLINLYSPRISDLVYVALYHGKLKVFKYLTQYRDYNIAEDPYIFDPLDIDTNNELNLFTAVISSSNLELIKLVHSWGIKLNLKIVYSVCRMNIEKLKFVVGLIKLNKTDKKYLLKLAYEDKENYGFLSKKFGLKNRDFNKIDF